MEQMLDKLSVCRLSAEMLEKKFILDTDSNDQNPYVRLEKYSSDLDSGPWNPLENAEQRWECQQYLHQRGSRHYSKDALQFVPYDEAAELLIFAPPNEIDARAVAELRRRKEKA